MDQLEAYPISGTEGAWAPFFSPDGEWVGFVAEGRTIKKVPLAGGSPVTLCSVATRIGGASWGSDDSIVFGGIDAGLGQVSAAGGTPQPVTTLNGDRVEAHVWPEMLPGGKAVLFTVWSGSVDAARIAVQSLESGERRMLVDGTHPRFSPSGHIVFARGDGSLWAVPFDLDGLDLTGSPIRIVEDVRVFPSGAAQFTLARDGSLVYVAGHVKVRNSEQGRRPSPPCPCLGPSLFLAEFGLSFPVAVAFNHDNLGVVGEAIRPRRRRWERWCPSA